jgi:hypothetical protein
MSPAQTEKALVKPVQPLGSFLGKLTPKPAEKPVEKVVEANDVVKEPVTETKVEEKAITAGTTTIEPVKKAEAGEHLKGSDVKPEEKPKDEKTEKRLKDAQTWGNEEHKARLDAERKNADLQAQLVRIEQKLDGTYVETTAPSPEQVAYDAEMRGKLRASHRAAAKKHGEEYVMQTVWNPDSPYMKLQAANPHIGQRVLASDDPVQEALDVLQEEEDARKYGRTSEEWKKSIEAELMPQLEKKIIEGLKTKPGPATNTLGNVRGEAERTSQKADAPMRLELGKVFPHGASRT